ncbi:MAG: YigZ family protein [Clostridiales bacterium]|nr:YigZ family protein [Candidatus Cacconaster stercorequi]
MGDVKAFRVPFEAAQAEFVEKRSRFIGHIWPVDSEEEAQGHIKAMKSQYYDARHNCWCYLLGDNVLRYSDDGEPQGTAGQPMLKVFQRENVTNVCCVVTRYFGGILLGAGGLTRAYSRSAKDTLTAAGAATVGIWAQAEIPCTYPLLERVKLEIAAKEGIIDDVAYGADILLRVSLPLAQTEALQKRLTELSAGGMTMTVTGQVSRPGPREEI